MVTENEEVSKKTTSFTLPNLHKTSCMVIIEYSLAETLLVDDSFNLHL